jgi:hypothetical protein
MNAKQIKGNIWKYYVFQVLLSMMFLTTAAVLFWQGNGLSLTEIMILQSLFSIVVVVLEIPTGCFEDVFERKNH